VSAFASRNGDTLYVMVWHYHDDDLPGPAADITLKLENLLGDLDKLTVEHFLIDATHSNAYAAWQKMGSPQSPTPAQYAELEQAGKLAVGDAIAHVAVKNRAATVELTLPRQGVSLLVLGSGESK
jgi:xylan 1,4-beta-xylosidase